MKLHHLLILMLLLIPTAAAEGETPLNATMIDAAMNVSMNYSVSWNLEDYPYLYNMTYWDDSASEYDNLWRIFTSPVQYWASAEMLGYWLYVVLIVVGIIFVYGKSRSIEITSMMLIVTSALLIVPSWLDALTIPSQILYLMYAMAVLGLAGGLYSVFGNGD